ncbi:MAG: hypothetical protein QXY39_03465 [Thermofilaceae archaeon]
MAEFVEFTEIDDVRYAVVRIREIERLNRLFSKLLEFIDSIPFLSSDEVNDIAGIIAYGYDEYVREMIRRMYRVENVCLDEGTPDECEAYVVSEEPDRIMFSPEVYIREDKYKG